MVGTNFRDRSCNSTTSWTQREASDTIAERMRTLEAVPDGRSDTVVATTTVPAVPAGEHSTTETVDMMTTRIYAAVETIRTVHDEASPSSK